MLYENATAVAVTNSSLRPPTELNARSLAIYSPSRSRRYRGLVLIQGSLAKLSRSTHRPTGVWPATTPSS